jgi:hypothetical protein
MMRAFRILFGLIGFSAVIYSLNQLIVQPVIAHFMYLKAVQEIESFGPSGAQYGSVGSNVLYGLVVDFGNEQDPSSKLRYLPYLTGTQPPPLPFTKLTAARPEYEQLLLIPGIQLLSIHLNSYFSDNKSLDVLRKLTYLKFLDLSDTARVSDEALPAIASCLLLEDLCLDGTNVTSEGLKVIGRMNRLRKLALWRTHVNDRFIDLVSDREFLPALEQLDVSETSVTQAALDRLKHKRPELKMEYSGFYFSSRKAEQDAAANP